MTRDQSRRHASANESPQPASPAMKVGHFTQLGRQPAPVQRRADAAADRAATRAATSIDAPAPDSIDEARATLPLAPPSGAPSATRLSRHQLEHARRRNLVEQHRLRFDPDAFSDAAVDSAAFAHAVADYQADAGLHVDGIAGPETCAHKGCIPHDAHVGAPASIDGIDARVGREPPRPPRARS